MRMNPRPKRRPKRLTLPPPPPPSCACCGKRAVIRWRGKLYCMDCTEAYDIYAEMMEDVQAMEADNE